MSILCSFHLSMRCQQLKPILTNRFQHDQAPVTSLITLRFDALQLAFVEQRRYSIQHIQLSITRQGRNSLCSLQCATIDKDGEATEESLLALIQQVVAPLERATQCLLPFRKILRPAGQ